MGTLDPALAARRFQLALDLYQAGEDLVRQRLRREHPGLSDAEIEARVVTWLRERPGAALGDGGDRPGRWPRGPA